MLPIDLTGCPSIDDQFHHRTTTGVPSSFQPSVMSRWLMDNWFIVRGLDGELYRWVDGVYHPAQETIEAAVIAKHGILYQRGRAEDVTNYLKKIPALDVSMPLDEGFLNLKNGVLNVDTLELLPHSPNFLTRIQIPVNWNPDAVCPEMDLFMSGGRRSDGRVFPGAVNPDSVDLVWEMMGYTLSGTNKYQKSFLLYGPGGNGKSKLLLFLNSLVGEQNFCANSFQALSSNKFRCAQLYGKLANICGDISEDLTESTETFKQLVGGDPIEVEKKGQTPFTLKNRAVLVFSANGFPKIADHSRGFFQRFVFISLPIEFRDSPWEIAGLETKICSQSELEGGLVKAVRGLKRLNSRGKFELTDSSARLLGDYKKAVDSVEAFVEAAVTFDPGLMIKGAVLYSVYKQWCIDNGLGAKSSIRFWREFRGNFGTLISEVKRDGYPYLKGCGSDYGVSVLGGWQ